MAFPPFPEVSRLSEMSNPKSKMDVAHDNWKFDGHSVPWTRAREPSSVRGNVSPRPESGHDRGCRVSNLGVPLPRISSTQIILIFRKVPKRFRQVQNQKWKSKKRRGDIICNEGTTREDKGRSMGWKAREARNKLMRHSISINHAREVMDGM